MNKLLGMIYLIVFLSLNFSCVENTSTEKETPKPELLSTSITDTLKFTSGVGAIFQDSKDNFWFGSRQEGVALYDGQSFIYFTNNDGLPDNQIRSIQEDKDGMIWFNTQNGVSTYDGKTINIQTKIDEAIPQGEWMKSDDDLWFGAGIKEGVFRYDGQNIHYLPFPSHKVINPHNNLFAVTCISKGKNNMIWIGTYAGVWGYNGSDFTVINDETLGLNRNTEPLHIRSIFEDSKGRLWIGNNGIGVLLKEGDSIINFSRENNLIHPTSALSGDKSPPGTLEHVFTISEDSRGHIWFGDRDTGVWRYDGKTVTNYTVDKNLNSQMVLNIYEDQNKNLLFGMADGGVYTFNGTSFDRYF